MNQKRKPLSAAIVAIASLVMLAGGTSTALAFHIPGATYTGTHSAGGAVSFSVSSDGNSIRNFRVENYQTEFCDVEFVQHIVGAPIVNNAFTFSSGLLELGYSGAFPGVQLAQGTFVDTECETGTLTWTARTTASPAGSAECITAQGPATEAEAALAAAQKRFKGANGKLVRAVKQARKAKTGVQQATEKSAKAKTKAQKRLRTAIRKRTQSNQDLRRAKKQRTQAASMLTQAQAARAAVCEPKP